MTNVDRALELVEGLVEIGCDEFVICAGARNAPLVKVLSEAQGLQKYYFPEERSASFFALGRMKSHGRPVAVITTSGTAAAELLPATIEAYYAGLPLALVTADRPPSHRGTGAPQSIEQRGLFSVYVEKCVDLWDGVSLETQSWSRQMPIHFNICFSEPLLDGPILSLKFKAEAPWLDSKMEEVSWTNRNILEAWMKAVKKPLIIVGPTAQSLREGLWENLKNFRGPMLVEALSGLKHRISSSQLMSERAAGYALRAGEYDAVIRVGGTPTYRLWRDLEDKFTQVPVLVLSDLPFLGLARKGVLRLPLSGISEVVKSLGNAEKYESGAYGEGEIQARLSDLLDKYPLSEPAWVRRLSEQVSGSSQVYLGNSLPVREWELVARFDQPLNFEANRGANGIDGQLSTFLGWADPTIESWCVLGDLTALYDLAGLWALRERPLERYRIVVINNGGGKIFRPMFKDDRFENIHQLEFKGWADMWRVAYRKWETLKDLNSDLPMRGALLEIKPDPSQTEGFWREWLAEGD